MEKYFTIRSSFEYISSKRIQILLAVLIVLLLGHFSMTFGANRIPEVDTINSKTTKLIKTKNIMISCIKLYIYPVGGIDTIGHYRVSVFSTNGDIVSDILYLNKKGNTEKDLEFRKGLPDSELSDLHLKLSRDSSKKTLTDFSLKVMIEKSDSTVSSFIDKTPTYLWVADSSIVLSFPKKTKKPKMIATQDSLEIDAALFNNINSVPDNDPPGFSQYYISGSIPLRKIQGIPDTTRGFWKNMIVLRNLYITPTLNASKLNYVPLDSMNKDYHANRLDLLQYAYFKVPINFNLATYIYHCDSLDYYHVYLDFFAEWIFTKDTISSSGLSNIITSIVYGPSIYYKSEKALSKDFTFEAGLSIFKIAPITNSINTDLAVQNRNLSSTVLLSNASKKLTAENDWFYSTEAFVIYWITKTTSAYLHFNYTGTSPFTCNYSNNYFQIQLGFSLNVTSILKNIGSSLTKK